MIAHDAGPDAPRATKLGNLLKEIVVRVEKEAEARRESIHVETRVNGGLHVGHSIREREGDLLRGGRSGFAHVVAGDGNRVPLGHVVRGPRERVGHKAHAVADGIDVCAARNVFLENVVLHGAGKLARVRSCTPRRRDVEREQDGGGGVDGHRRGDAVEGDAGEEALHVFEGIDGDSYLADFADGHGVVGVVADLRGQIEGNR